MKDYKDKVIKCIGCGQDFTFTVNDQIFYAEKGFNNQPKRCKTCREKRKLKEKYIK